jgi:predicted transcriptional regulator
MFKFRLIESELIALKFLFRGETTLQKLSRETGLSISRLSEVLKSLSIKGFIHQISRRPKVITISELEHAMVIKSLFGEIPHINWEKQLKDSACTILLIFAQQWRQPVYIAKLSNISLRSVYNILTTAKATGLIEKRKSSYRIPERHYLLRRFLLEFRRYYNSRLCFELNPQGWKLWEGDTDILIASPTPIDHPKANVTGIMSFDKVNAVINEFVYIITERDIIFGLEERLVHTIRWRPEDERVKRIVMDTILKNKDTLNPKIMLREAERMDLKEKMESILRYIYDSSEDLR